MSKIKSGNKIWERFKAINYYLELPAGKFEKHYYDIEHRYNESHRHYHTVDHIAHCLKEFDEVRNKVANPIAVEFAIMYHDSIYDTEKHDNEIMSAELCLTVCKALGIENVGNVAYDIITQTSHKDTSIINLDKIPSHNLDIEHTLDIDLSILGQSIHVFDFYELNIRREYDWVDEKTYIKERTRVLQGFLNRPAIYLTTHFRDKYENVARFNLNRSIQRLNEI